MKSTLSIAALSASASALALQDTSDLLTDFLQIENLDDVHFNIHSEKCGIVLSFIDKRRWTPSIVGTDLYLKMKDGGFS